MTKKFYTKAEVAGIPESELQPIDKLSVTAREPTICENTGRLLTEWYETPIFTEEDIRKIAELKAGFENGVPKKMVKDMTDEEKDQFKVYRGEINSKKQTKFRGGMSKQEVQIRMNEASRLVDPDNQKVLDKATQERTGLEYNPLYGIELLVRSGGLSPKDMLTALKTLSEYTHSKAPTVATVNNTHSWDDYAYDLAVEQGYEIVEVIENKKPADGMGINFIDTKKRKENLVEEAQVITDAAFEDFDNDLEGFELKDFYNDGEED